MEMVPYRRVPGWWPWRRRRMVAVPAVRLVLPGPERCEPVVPVLPLGVGGDELRVRAYLRVALGVGL